MTKWYKSKTVQSRTAMTVAMAAVVTIVYTQEPEEVCPTSPPSMPYFEVDPNALKYLGPHCADGEECFVPENWHDQPPMTVWTPEGLRYRYVDAGMQYTYECPDKLSYKLAEDQWVKKDFKDGCWKREEVVVLSCPEALTTEEQEPESSK